MALLSRAWDDGEQSGGGGVAEPPWPWPRGLSGTDWVGVACQRGGVRRTNVVYQEKFPAVGQIVGLLLQTRYPERIDLNNYN